MNHPEDDLGAVELEAMLDSSAWKQYARRVQKVIEDDVADVLRFSPDQSVRVDDVKRGKVQALKLALGLPQQMIDEARGTQR